MTELELVELNKKGVCYQVEREFGERLERIEHAKNFVDLLMDHAISLHVNFTTCRSFPSGINRLNDHLKMIQSKLDQILSKSILTSENSLL